MEKVIVLIHGVESNAGGMEKVKQHFYDDPNFPKDERLVKVFNYNHFPAIYSALPWYSTIRDTYSDYTFTYLENISLKYPDADIEVLAHSFGTYLLLKALKGRDFSINKAVLLGSVLPVDLDFSDIGIKYIKNYVAELDMVQYFATWFTSHFGMSGVDGFNSDHVENVNPPGLWTHLSYSESENIDYIKREFE